MSHRIKTYLLICSLMISITKCQVSLNINNKGYEYDGLGGLDAVGGARLLFEYPEPTRSEILDLFFKPNSGANWQMLKSEINGDVDSSYGSGSSFLHFRNDNNTNKWNRGTHNWLLLEALKRNPNIQLYALSWGDPYWVGQNSSGFLSQDGVNYHIQWLQGIKKQFNVTYNYIGIWNESPYTKDYIIELKNALKQTKGLENVQIVAVDGNPEPIINDTYFNKSMLESVDVIGVHSDPWKNNPQYLNILMNEYHKKYWHTESDALDGPYPKWQGAVEWVRRQIENYVLGNATATFLCPIAHSWTLNYGRHMHGGATFTEPWSGFYQLGASFWTQSHITQFTEPGWYFLNKPASNNVNETVFYATYVSINDTIISDFTIVITNEDVISHNFTFMLENGFENWCKTGVKLEYWISTEFSWFIKVEKGIIIENKNEFTVIAPPDSVSTITSITKGHHQIYSIPKRFQFPIPYVLTFDDQNLGEPGKRLSDLYGAFDVNIDPINNNNYVLKQAARENPGKDAWTHRFNSLPITTFPSGTNWVNYNISAYVLGTGISNKYNWARICGRIPIWEPHGYEKNYTIGICLSLQFGTGAWNIYENTLDYGSEKIYEQSSSNAGIYNEWSYLSLGFDGSNVEAIVNDIISPIFSVTHLMSGVSGIGSDWGDDIYFDNVTLQLNHNHIMTPNGSYILDCLVGNIYINTFNGWVGFVLSMNNSDSNLYVNKLGRFKIPNNKINDNQNKHEMNIIHVLSKNEYKFLLNPSPIIDLKTCVSDLNGFCYTEIFSESVELEIGETYFIVSLEMDKGDYFMNMSDPATGTTQSHRDGLTYMSYLAPNKGNIIGRVLFNNNTKQIIINKEIDTSYGPVNLVINN
eukprot:304162_1